MDLRNLLLHIEMHIYPCFNKSTGIKFFRFHIHVKSCICLSLTWAIYHDALKVHPFATTGKISSFFYG